MKQPKPAAEKVQQSPLSKEVISKQCREYPRSCGASEPEQVANPEPPQAMPEPQASADEKKSEQDAQMTGSQTEVKQDEEAKEESPMGAAVQLSVHAGRDLDISGAFKVRAKSDQGFWRAGIQFLRTKETVLLVVDQVPEDQPKTVLRKMANQSLFCSLLRKRQSESTVNLT